MPSPGCAASHASANRRIRRALSAVTASAGMPKPVPERVLTSTTTKASPSRATMSSSPRKPAPVGRQLRSRIVSPADARCRAAVCSPKRPTASLTRIPADTPLVNAGPVTGRTTVPQERQSKRSEQPLCGSRRFIPTTGWGVDTTSRVRLHLAGRLAVTLSGSAALTLPRILTDDPAGCPSTAGDLRLLADLSRLRRARAAGDVATPLGLRPRHPTIDGRLRDRRRRLRISSAEVPAGRRGLAPRPQASPPSCAGPQPVLPDGPPEAPLRSYRGPYPNRTAAVTARLW